MSEIPKIEKTDAEWRAELTEDQYRIMRCHGTERAGTSPLNAEKRAGMFLCAGCRAELFPADTKFESGTGWPSFYAHVQDGAVEPTVARNESPCFSFDSIAARDRDMVDSAQSCWSTGSVRFHWA